MFSNQKFIKIKYFSDSITLIKKLQKYTINEILLPQNESIVLPL